MKQGEQSKPPALSCELKPAVYRLTPKDYSKVLAEAIGVLLLAMLGTAVIGHIFGEDLYWD